MLMRGVLDVPIKMIVIIPRGDYVLVYIKYTLERGIFCMGYGLYCDKPYFERCDVSYVYPSNHKCIILVDTFLLVTVIVS